MAVSDDKKIILPPRIVEASFVLSAPEVGKIDFLDLSEVAIFGRSNVGKSSLINCLTQRKALARVSNRPGRTALLNVFKASIAKADEKKEFCLVDLPGVGYANVSKSELRRYSKIISGYVSESPALSIIFHLFDIRRVPNPEDLRLKRELSDLVPNYFVVLTKADKLPVVKRNVTKKKLAGLFSIELDHLLVCSATKKFGINKVLESIWRVL